MLDLMETIVSNTRCPNKKKKASCYTNIIVSPIIGYYQVRTSKKIVSCNAWLVHSLSYRGLQSIRNLKKKF